MKQLFIALLILPFLSFSQELDSLEHTEVRGELFVGYPNVDNLLLYSDQNDIDDDAINYRTLGTPVAFGFKFGRMTSDRLEFGIELNYVLSGYEYDYQDTTTFQGTTTIGTYHYEFRKSQFRFLVHGHYHYIKQRWVEAYVGAGVGYKNITRKKISNQPGFIPSETENIIPFTARLATGVRLFPTNNFGVMLEAGIFGGTIFQAGIVYRAF